MRFYDFLKRLKFLCYLFRKFKRLQNIEREIILSVSRLIISDIFGNDFYPLGHISPSPRLSYGAESAFFVGASQRRAVLSVSAPVPAIGRGSSVRAAVARLLSHGLVLE